MTSLLEAARKTPNNNQIKKIPALFVDRDGVLNFERQDYVKSVSELKIIAGACEQVARIAEKFPYIFVATNQSVVGRGLISEDTLKGINDSLSREFFNRTGRHIDRVFYCPHKPEDQCNCRKPKTELFERAAEEYNLDLTRSVFIGDKDSDKEASRRIDCGFIRVKTNTSEIIQEASVPV
jgi:D-glycero-D-manno-heptose 1,7-bisphosphate phosphatase